MASRRQLRHTDYTVGWICALTIELTATKAMLDEVHMGLPQSHNDHNIYTLGTLHGHNVVIACLPLGVYGYSTASIVATQMLSAFPAIRFSLLVGIGGGVPQGSGGRNKADVRLGDVVVSKPTAEFGGVVQYDYGKLTSNNCFERIGSLNKPPSILLSALATLEADHNLGISQILSYHSEMLSKFPTMESFARRPHEKLDMLFESHYSHVESMDGTCRNCRSTYLVHRLPRPSSLAGRSQIHYGVIASGNKVIKDGLARDQIVDSLDDNVLCFEMEAAGIMDNFPCIVIRGISDYADSHKNDHWKSYAATMAAAYAKELLSVIPVQGVYQSPLIAPHSVERSTRHPSHQRRRDDFQEHIQKLQSRRVREITDRSHDTQVSIPRSQNSDRENQIHQPPHNDTRSQVPRSQTGSMGERIDQSPRAYIHQGDTTFHGQVYNSGIIMANIAPTTTHDESDYFAVGPPSDKDLYSSWIVNGLTAKLLGLQWIFASSLE